MPESHVTPAVEGAPMFGLITIVSPDSALESLISFKLAEREDTKIFLDRNHMSLVKPASEQDEVYKWVNEEIRKEFERLSGRPPRSTRPYLCERSWLD
jgi:hypothetical protein